MCSRVCCNVTSYSFGYGYCLGHRCIWHSATLFPHMRELWALLIFYWNGELITCTVSYNGHLHDETIIFTTRQISTFEVLFWGTSIPGSFRLESCSIWSSLKIWAEVAGLPHSRIQRSPNYATSSWLLCRFNCLYAWIQVWKTNCSYALERWMIQW